MSTQACRSNSNSMFTRPVSFAPRLNTHPPQPRIAPVSACTSRDGSSVETAFICIAQGMFGACRRLVSCIVIFTCCLSESGWGG